MSAARRTTPWHRGLAALGLLLASGAACASFGAHYAGEARNGLAFRLYIDGGAPLARQGTWQAIRLTVHAERGTRPLPAFDDCTYHYDEADRHAGRITCATRRGSPLSGVVYEREAAGPGADADGTATMVCVARCGPRVPVRLTLDAEEDNH